MNVKECHKVEVTYHPDGGSPYSEIEILNFTTEQNARGFASRQENIPQVMNAKYLGEN